MSKNFEKKFLSVLMSIVVMLTISGCNKRNENYMQISVEQLTENDDFEWEEVSKLAVDLFFKEHPIYKEIDRKEGEYQNKDVDEALKFLDLDYKFASAYDFLKQFLNVYGNSNSNNIQNLIKYEKGINDRVAEFTIEKESYEYMMKFVEQNLIIEGISYQDVTQRYRDNNCVFEKSFNSKIKHRNGKQKSKDELTYTYSYSISLFDQNNSQNLTLTIVWEETIQKEDLKIIDSNKQLFYYVSGELIKQKDLSERAFYKYIDIIYDTYMQKLTRDEFLQNNQNLSKIKTAK